jgi:phage gp46-like protein
MFNISDIKLRRRENDSVYDINFVNGDFERMQGLDTAILMSLTCERRANSSEVSLPQYRRGWVGNEINGFVDFEYGSKIWILEQARATQETLNNAITYEQNALQWLIDDEFADAVIVEAEYNDLIELILDITFVKNNNIILNFQFNVWKNTFVDDVV